MALPELPEHPSWTIVLIALSAPLLTFLASYLKLRSQGINSANIEEIKDRARFRSATLNRITELEKQLSDRDIRIDELQEELTGVKMEVIELKHQLEVANDRLSRR